MIKVNINKDNIVITGHAMYDDYGKDIVCASASSIVISTVNAILKFDKDAISYQEEKDKLVIDILKKDDITKKLIGNMVDMLNELSNQYPKNIKVIGG